MGGKKTKGARTDRGKRYAFYFIEPKKNLNSDAFARKLMGNRRVHEVYITEGACGFVVKAGVKDGERESPIPSNMLAAPCRKVGLAISRYAYRR
ncbi:MAG: hypothetical protein KGI04_00080 [Candidatus Micrarchaeota archaeon]|nr:hypothetical protein [Candidatus Micrarchaeota archaeon]